MSIQTRLGVMLIVLLSFGAAHASGSVEVSNAWIPQAPPGASTMAGYLDLKNTGDMAVSVVSAKSDRFGDVSMHQTVVEDGMARMRPLKNVDVAPGKTFTFAPGGNHLMLTDPVSPVAPGEKIPIGFVLSDGLQVQALFEVRAPEDAVNADHQHQH